MNLKNREGQWLFLSMVLVLLVAVLSQVNYFISGKSVYHISSIASSTIYYIKLQLVDFQNFDFYPQYWSNRIYTSGPVHTGLGFYNPLFLFLIFFSKLSHALIFYDILLKFIGGTGLFLLFRKYGFSAFSSLCCALIYPLNPFVSAFGSDPQFVGVIYWMPLTIFSLELLVKNVHKRLSVGFAYAVVVAFFLGLMYLSTNIQGFTFFFCFVLVPYILLRSSAVRFGRGVDARRLFIFVAAVFILVFLLVVFELVPTLSVLRAGDRNISGNVYVRILLYSLLLIVTVLGLRHTVSSKRKMLSYFSLFLIAVCFIFSEGGRSIYNLTVVDYFYKLHETHFVFNEYFIRYFTFLQLILLLVAIFKSGIPRGGALVLFYLSAGYFVLNFIPRQEYLGLAHYFYWIYPDYYIRYSFIPLVGIMVGLAWSLDTVFKRLKNVRLSGAVFLVAILLIAENYLVFFNRTLFTSGFSYMEKQCPEYNFLKELRPLVRVESVYNDDHARWKKSFNPSIMPKWLMPPYFEVNTFSRVGIGVIPKDNFVYNAAALPLYFGLDEKRLLNPLLSLAGVRYIFSLNRLSEMSSLKLAMKGDEYYIYENLKALSRVFLVPAVKRFANSEILPAMRQAEEKDFLDAAYINMAEDIRLDNSGRNAVTFMREDSFVSNLGSVSVMRYDNEVVEIHCTISEHCLLVFTDTFFPGWKAFVAGQQKRIIRTDYIFRGLQLSPGTYTVVMKYDSKANRFALWTSVSTFTVVMLYMGWFFVHKRKYVGNKSA